MGLPLALKQEKCDLRSAPSCANTENSKIPILCAILAESIRDKALLHEKTLGVEATVCHLLARFQMQEGMSAKRKVRLAESTALSP